jgi:hypothetical protein
VWARFATSRKQLSDQGARGAHEEAVGLLLVAGGEEATSTSSLSRATSPATAAIVAHRPPKVSKVGSPSRTHAVGEVLVEN